MQVHRPKESRIAGRRPGVDRGLRRGASLVLALLAACGNAPSAEPTASPSAQPSPLFKSDARPPAESCNPRIEFEPGFLPGDFTRRQFRGPAPSAAGPDGKDQVIVHYRGAQGRALEIRRPATMFLELAVSEESSTVQVLGQRTPNFGPVEPGGTELIVQFTYASGGDEHGERCSSYSLNEYGLSLGTLKRVAEALRPT